MSMIQQEKISIIACPSEIAAGKLGNAQGVVELINLFNEQKIYPFAKYVFTPIQNKLNEGKTFFNAKHIEQVYHNLVATYHTVNSEMREGRFCVNVLGDHSNAIATFSCFADIYGVENSGLIWVDAHADMHSPYTTPSGNMHGMPLAALMATDNIENVKNAVEVELKAWWDRFKNIGQLGSHPKLLPRNLAIIGLRDFESQEEALFNKLNVKYFAPDTIKEIGIEAVMKQAKEYLNHCNSLMCSFDVDSIDSSLVKGTGTPVVNGLTLEQARFVFDFVFVNPEFKSLDITEFNPTLDSSNQTAERVLHLFK